MVRPTKHRIEIKAEQSYASLTEPERVWYTVTRLLFNIRDGGLISYYYNGYAVHLDAACSRSKFLMRVACWSWLSARTRSLGPKCLETANGSIRSSNLGPMTLKRLSVWSLWGERTESQIESSKRPMRSKLCCRLT